MKDTYTFYAESVEDISPADMRNDNDEKQIEVTLAGVDPAEIVTEVGINVLLDEMSVEDIKEYLANKEQPNDEED